LNGMNNLPAGTYLLLVNYEGGRWSQKVVKPE
jgi:hypothetical protein